MEIPVAAIRTAQPDNSTGFANASRALVAAAADLVLGVQRRVVGDANIRTARDNAWAATLEDRARNEARAELTREVAALVARHPSRRALAKTR
ncbi:hypothetical protein Abr02nite_67640 [Paractinoplanes brasiliensis]|nr:hypothetical protein Abr02nite_67640 [Actinoplanes brasiliensis]